MTGDDIDEGGLARAVIADKAKLLAALNRNRNIAGGDHRAQSLLAADGLKGRGHLNFSTGARAELAPLGRKRSGSEPSPSGRKRMISKRKTPSAPYHVLGKLWVEKEHTDYRIIAAPNTAATLI